MKTAEEWLASCDLVADHPFLKGRCCMINADGIRRIQADAMRGAAESMKKWSLSHQGVLHLEADWLEGKA